MSPPLRALSILVLLGPLSGADSSRLVPVFVETARQAGLNTIVVSGDSREKRFLLESVGGGLAVIDYDNDGWMDLYIVNGGTVEGIRAKTNKHRNVLYKNNRNGTFTDVTALAGVRGNGNWGKGALAADLNNDEIGRAHV